MRKRTFFSYNSSLVIVFLLLSSLSGGLSTSATTNQDSLTPSQSEDTSGLVKVLNYNTVEQGANEEWKEIIRRENPDIIIQVETGFKENLKPWAEELNSYFPNEQEYKVYGFDGTSGTDGQAVYSRYPVIATNVLYEVPLDDGTMHEMNHPYMEVVIDMFGLQIHVFANHLSCCDSFAARMLEQEGIINYMDSLGDVPIMYGGDFNSDSPQDTGDIAPLQGSLGTEPIEMMLDASHEHGPEVHTFTDTYRELNPDRKGYTLNHKGDYQSIDHFRGRIDYIFVNQHLTKYLVNSSVVSDYKETWTASDHKPMYTWFNFNADQVDLRPPVNPQKLKLTEVTTSSATLSWNANTEEDLFKYSIYRNGSLLSDVPGNTTTFTDDIEYNSSKLYFYQVSATDNSTNEGRKSLPVFADPNQGELFAPYDISVQVFSNGGSTGVNWTIEGTSNIPIDYIKVYKTIDANATYQIDSILSGSASSRSIDIPPNYFTTYVRIAVGNVFGESDLTDATFTDGPISANNDPTPDRSNSIQEVFQFDVDENAPEPATILTYVPPSSSSDSTGMSLPILPILLSVSLIPVFLRRESNSN